MDEVAQEVDYVKLRKIYFNYQAGREPSHSNEKSEHKGYLNDSESVKTHELMTMVENSEKTSANLSFGEELEDDYLQELGEFKSKLSQHANDMINKLYEKYGAQIYSKIIQLIKDKDYMEWNQIEKELLSGNFELMIENKQDMAFDNIENLNFNKEFNSTLDFDYQKQDLNYLDALVTQDHQRLNHLQSDKSSISSIFSEILENEQQGHSNYQDDVFEKNIELIFNPDIDLDNSQWPMNEDNTLDNYSEVEGVIDDGDSLQHLDEFINQDLELLQNNLKISTELPREEVSIQTVEDHSSSAGVTDISEINPENVVVRKIIAKKRTNFDLNKVLIVLCFLTVILSIGVIMLLGMVLN